MKVEVGAATDVGKVREGNEDSFLVQPPMYAVADGMGGALGGEVASSLALETIEQLSREGDEALVDRIRRANEVVFERSTSDQRVSGMGTTLTVAQLDDDALRLGHVGDSRAYLFRAGDLRQLTEDHTLVGRMVKAGEITREEADTHPHRNVLIRVVGTEPEVIVDEVSVALLDGDRVLLCTDGLTGMLTEDQIRAILESEPDPQKAAERLVRAANRAGGVDNITVVVLDAHGEGGGDDANAGSPSSPTPSRGARPAQPDRAMVRRWALRAGIVVLVLAALVVGIRIYADRQWYVGVDNVGRVAVFQGIPASVGGVSFSHLAVSTDISAAEAATLPVYADLPSGITADSRTAALAVVAQIRQDLTVPGTGAPKNEGRSASPSQTPGSSA
jgi:serine/threonine protein phosphatase PrpC